MKIQCRKVEENYLCIAGNKIIKAPKIFEDGHELAESYEGDVVGIFEDLENGEVYLVHELKDLKKIPEFKVKPSEEEKMKELAYDELEKFENEEVEPNKYEIRDNYVIFRNYTHSFSRKNYGKWYWFVNGEPVFKSPKCEYVSVDIGERGYTDRRGIAVCKLEDGDVVMGSGGSSYGAYGNWHKKYYEFENGELKEISKTQYMRKERR